MYEFLSHDIQTSWANQDLMFLWNVSLIIYWSFIIFFEKYTTRIISEWSEASISVFLSHSLVAYQFNIKITLPFVLISTFKTEKGCVNIYWNIFRQIDQVKSKQISAFESATPSTEWFERWFDFIFNLILPINCQPAFPNLTDDNGKKPVTTWVQIKYLSPDGSSCHEG